MATPTTVGMTLPPEYIQQRTQELLNTYFGVGQQGDPNFVQGLISQPRTVPAQEAVALSPVQQQLIDAANTAATAITPQTLGIGSFQPFLDAAAAQTAAGQEQLAAATGIFDPASTTAGVSTFMSPYQQNVTQEALTDIDRQAEAEAMRQNILAAQEEPFSRLTFGANLLAGVPQSTTTLAQAQAPNPYLTALQTGILGLGVLGGQGGNLGSFLTD